MNIIDIWNGEKKKIVQVKSLRVNAVPLYI